MCCINSPNMLIIQERSQQQHTKNWQQKLNCSISFSALPSTLRIQQYSSQFCHTPWSDISFSIWKRIRFICSIHLGLYSLPCNQTNHFFPFMKALQNRKYFRIHQRYPFDWKSFPGYLLAWLIQCLFPPSGGSMYMQFSNIFFGSCGLFIFMAKDITRDMAAFNASAKTTTSDETHRKLTRSFCDIVQNYTDAKQWGNSLRAILWAATSIVNTHLFSRCIKDFNQMYQYSLFAYFLWNMLSLSSVLITLQFQLVECIKVSCPRVNVNSNFLIFE